MSIWSITMAQKLAALLRLIVSDYTLESDLDAMTHAAARVASSRSSEA